MNFNNLSQIRIVTFLSCLIVPLLVTGPFLPDLLLSSLSLWFLYYTFKKRIFYIFRNKFFYLFLSFCLFCIFSSLMSDNILLSFESSLFYFRIGLFCLLISFLIDKDENILKYFYYTFLLTFSALFFYAYVEYIFELNAHPTRISSFFGDELILGSYVSRLLPLIVALFFIKKNKTDLEKYLFIIFLILAYFVVILSGERAAFFYVNLFFLLFIFFNKVKKEIYFLTLFLFLTSLTFFVLSTKFNNTGNNLINRYSTNIYKNMNLSSFFLKDDQISENDYDTEASKKNKNKIVIFTEGHEALYFTAFKMFLDKPIIGHGPKMFRVKCSNPNYSHGKYSCMTHPHNFYIQLLSETGIVGFTFLFGLFLYVLYLLFKFFWYNFIKKKKIYSSYHMSLLVCLLITIWPVVPNGNFFNNHLMILYCLPIGFFRKEIKV